MVVLRMYDSPNIATETLLDLAIQIALTRILFCHHTIFVVFAVAPLPREPFADIRTNDFMS